MRKNYSNLLIIVLTIFSVLVGTYFWNNINLPYNNPKEIIGIYSQFEHSDLTDTARYMFFVGLPLIIFFLLTIILKRKECNSFKNIFLSFEIKETKQNNLLYLFLCLFIFILIIKFFSHEFSFNKMDLFHEGQQLGGTNIFNKTKKLFVHTYFTTSLFIDTLNAKIAWLISDKQTLGAYRVFILFLQSLTEIIYVVFCYQLAKSFSLEKNTEILFFFVLSLFSIYLVSNSLTINFRDIPLVLFLICSLKLLKSPAQNYNFCFSIGFLTIFTLLWSLDRGVYLIATVIPLIFLLFIRKKKSQIITILAGAFISWFGFYLIIGHEEFIAFIDNSITILANSEMLNGIIYPTPFSNDENSTRGTKNLLIIILNGIFVTSTLLSKNSKIPNETKLFLFILFILSFLFYKTGISRADGGHIKQGLSFHLVLFAIFILEFFFGFLQKYDIEKKLSYLHKNFLSSIIILIFVLCNFNTKSYLNIKSFSKRYQNYIKLDNTYFLEEDQIKLLERLKILTVNENCFQVFTYESSIPYLIDKKSCSKFYHIFNLGSKKHQYDFIEDLKLASPQYILFEGTYDDWNVVPKKRFPYIYDYLLKNYKIGEEFISWKILYLEN